MNSVLRTEKLPVVSVVAALPEAQSAVKVKQSAPTQGAGGGAGGGGRLYLAGSLAPETQPASASGSGHAPSQAFRQHQGGAPAPGGLLWAVETPIMQLLGYLTFLCLGLPQLE